MPLFLHVSVGGDHLGLVIGHDAMTWSQLARTLSGLLQDLEAHPHPVVLTLAGRGAAKNELIRLLLEHSRSSVPVPDHAFLLVDTPPTRTDAMLAWNHFYAEMANIDFAVPVVDGHTLRKLRSRLRRLGMGSPHYVPWSLTRGRVTRPRWR